MSASVSLLRARLADISTSISRQLRQVLEGLERSIITQNHLFDPIARLPVEISSEIFVLCLPDPRARHPSPVIAPLLLLRVCATWANIARSTPALWDSIVIDFPRTEGFKHLFDSYLARSQSQGLSLTVSGEFNEDDSALLCGHAHRMQQLGSNNNILPSAFLNLRTLTFDFLIQAIDLTSVFGLLRAAAPSLVEFTFNSGYFDDPHTDSLTLPRLQSLCLGEDPWVCRIYILQYLSLPSLRTLTISLVASDDDEEEAVLISFLTQLEAPLQSLRLNLSHTIRPPEFYTRLFGPVPTLTCLWLSWETASGCTLFWDFLRSSPPGLLAQLRDLTILVRRPVSDFHPLCDALSAWRSQITSFRFIQAYFLLSPPPDYVLHTLRQLTTECGMKIHFGSQLKNYV
ncbi:hypothetical protein C8J57DRAFT_160749 [Mycena rebaudengoi]|nr:hypothetical protein C8J57DRAFT_160749 [Mycena rebaudengoi]